MMPRNAVIESTHVQAGGEARSSLYALFAKALSHPTEEIMRTFAMGQFALGVLDLVQVTSLELEELPPRKTVSQSEDLKSVYASTFEAGLPKASLRESHYVKEGEKILFEDLFRFYDHFGLDTASGGLREWPDHIAVELEFMHYLAWLEIGAGESVMALRQAQKDFLDRHLQPFAAGLADRFEQTRIPDPYQMVARLLAGFVTADKTELEG